ncbi:MAG TPA: hypothetical protein VLJ88_12870 [Propionibacteriaceae bacterium]|nr:hypothetical protein [Propionibacteriaceae bacterium]
MSNAYLEGTYSEVYPLICADEDGMRGLFRQFSFPGGCVVGSGEAESGPLAASWHSNKFLKPG